MNKLKRVCLLLMLFGFSIALMAKDTATIYFPATDGSFWIYEDQDGNEIKRISVAMKIVDEETFNAFKYEPAIEERENYNYHLHPFLYQVGKEWITFYVGNEIENTVKSTISKKLDEIVGELREKYTDQLPSDVKIDFNYTIEPNAHDDFYFVPIPSNYKEIWMSMEVSVKIQISMDIKGVQINIPNENKLFSFTMNISETGKLLEKESVKTPAGQFDDCLKIEYRTKTKSTTNKTSEIQQSIPIQTPKDIITTLWLAPNVGIVKLMSHQDNSEEVSTVELKSYEIKTAESVENNK